MISFSGIHISKEVVHTSSSHCVSILQPNISVLQVLLKAMRKLYGEQVSTCNGFLNFPNLWCTHVFPSWTPASIPVFKGVFHHRSFMKLSASVWSLKRTDFSFQFHFMVLMFSFCDYLGIQNTTAAHCFGERSTSWRADLTFQLQGIELTWKLPKSSGQPVSMSCQRDWLTASFLKPAVHTDAYFQYALQLHWCFT